MNIDRQLHLVLPVDQPDGGQIFIHATPVSQETFDAYYLVLAKTFAEIHAQGLGVIAGPRVAAKLLADVAREAGTWDGPTGVERGLLAEIRRLINVYAPGENGWTLSPFEDARAAGVIDPQDASEGENAVVFFTLSWLMHRRTEREGILQSAVLLWGGQITSSTCTEFRDSLPTLTTDASTGASPG